MPGKSKTPEQQYIDAITRKLDADNGPKRKAKPHSRDKLAILSAYLPAFTKACQKAPQRYFIDALAGPGLYQFDDRITLGSTLIALETQPPFTKVLAMEKNRKYANALETRCNQIDKQRAKVRRGDCNRDLLPFMKDELDPRAPMLVFIDPEGFDVNWQTIVELSRFKPTASKVELSRFKPTARKPELLIYFDAPAFRRFDVDTSHSGRMNVDDAMPTDSDWRNILRRCVSENTPVDHVMLEIYKNGLRQLGYLRVDSRPIGPQHPADRSRVHYYLVHASDFDPGPGRETPMEWVFRKLWGAASDQIRLPNL